MSVTVRDPSVSGAIRTAFSGAFSARADATIAAAVAAFADANITVEVFSASNVLLHTVVRGTWTIDTVADRKRMVAGAVVSQTTHASGTPTYAYVKNSTGTVIFALTAGVGTGDIVFLAPVVVGVRIAHGALILTTLISGVTGARTRLVSDAMLANFMAHKAANTEQYQRLLSQSNSASATINTVNRGLEVFSYISSAALAYRATGDVAYKNKVLGWFDYILSIPTSTFTTGPSAPSTELYYALDLKWDSGFAVGERTTSVAYALDLLYDELSQYYRSGISTWLMDWADFIVYDAASPAMLARRAPHTNDVYGKHPYATYKGAAANNYYWKYASAIHGVLVAHDDTGTLSAGGYEGSRREWHLADFAQRWAAQVEPVFANLTDSGPGNGIFKESSSYDSSGALLAVTNALAYAGYPEYSTLSFIALAPKWRIAVWMPGEMRRANFGDQASSAKDRRFYGNRNQGVLTQAIPGISTADKQMLHKWLQGYPTTGLTYGTPMVNEMTILPAAYDVAADYSNAERSLFSGGGSIWLYRNSFTDANTTVIVWTGGAPTEGHMYKNGGAAVVWKGDGYVLGNANLYSTSGIQANTIYHNCLSLFYGTQYCGQCYASNTPTYPQLFNDAVDGDYLAAGCNSAHGYQYGSFGGSAPLGYTSVPHNTVPYMNDNTRKMVYVTSIETMFVLDRASLNPAKPIVCDRAYTWWATREAPPTVAGQDFDLTADSTTHHTLGRVISGGSPEVDSEELALLEYGYVLPVYCVRTRKTGPTTTPDRILTGMQFVANATTTVPHAWSAEIVSVTGSAYRGFAAGSVAVMFGDTDIAATTTTYETAATTHYVTDCVGGRAYTIQQQPTGGGAVEATINATASAAGILKFTSANGAVKRFVLG
jgi:hypothetical protein